MLTRHLFAVANLLVELSSVKRALENRQHDYTQCNTHSSTVKNSPSVGALCYHITPLPRANSGVFAYKHDTSNKLSTKHMKYNIILKVLNITQIN